MITTKGVNPAICRSLEIPEPVTEFMFHPRRKWRLDYAFPEFKVAVEIEGGIWTGGRHTRGSGFIGDMAKYNELAARGWRLLRFPPKKVDYNLIYRTLFECPESDD